MVSYIPFFSGESVGAVGSILSIYLLNPLVATVSFLCAFKVRKLKPIEMLSVE